MQTSGTETDPEGFFEESEGVRRARKQRPRKKPRKRGRRAPPGAEGKGAEKGGREEDWVVPVKEDKSATTRMEDYSLQFDDLDYDQGKLVHVVYYIFKGHFDIVVTLNADAEGRSAEPGKVG